MKKITFPSLLFTLLIYLLFQINLIAQSALREASLSKQIKNSSLVVEGEVIAQESFWDAESELIYTANRVKVYKVFKGKSVQTIEVNTIGGIVGFRALISSTSLKLQKRDVGIFMLSRDNTSISSKNNLKQERYRPYGASQGFYKYNLYNDIAVNPFNKKRGIKSSFYNEIIGHTKENFKTIFKFDAQAKSLKSKQAKGLLVPSAITFSPTTSTAGTKSVLTISGTGFGATQGTVWFSNADDGGGTFISALASEVLTWKADGTEITVEVPSRAGTGPIMVEDSANDSATSAASLTVSYAEINLPGSRFQAQHIEDAGNSNGGYTWEMFTDFFNDTEHAGAKAAFERAFNIWICETGINWEISSSATTTDIIGVADLSPPFDGELDADGENVIRFDNGSELDVDVLGTCYSWYASCNGTDWFVSDLDIVFNDAVDVVGTPATETWYFGTGAPGADQYDFESVALHELGHGHQLAHVIDDSADVMHYALTNGESQRVLGVNNKTAAGNVQARSTGVVVCSQPLMTNASCPLSVDENQLEEAISIFPNPSGGQFYISNASFINLQKAVIYDIGGRLISEYDLSNSSRTKAIPTQGISKGIYFVNIHSDLASITKKIILE